MQEHPKSQENPVVPEAPKTAEASSSPQGIGRQKNAEASSSDVARVRKGALDTAALVEAAQRVGLDVTRVDDNFAIFRDDQAGFTFRMNMSSGLSTLDRLVTSRRPETRQVLQHNGIPITHGATVRSPEELEEALKELSGPWVISPVADSGGATADAAGEGSVAGLQDADQVLKACAPYLDEGVAVVVEEMLDGVEARVAVVRGEAVATFARESAETAKTAETADTVGAVEARFEVIEQLHPEIKDLAVKAASLFPTATHSGVDILVESLTQPLGGQRVAVTRVDVNNEFYAHANPASGKTANQAGNLVADRAASLASKDLVSEDFVAEDLASAEIEAARALESTIPLSALAPRSPAKPQVTPKELERKFKQARAHKTGSAAGGEDLSEEAARLPVLNLHRIQSHLDALLPEGQKSCMGRSGLITVSTDEGPTRLLHAYGTSQHTTGIARSSRFRTKYLEALGLAALGRFRVGPKTDECLFQTMEEAIRKSNTPWSLRMRGDRGGFSETIYTDPEDLTEAMEMTRGRAFTLAQVWEGPALVVLARGTEVLTRQLVQSPRVTGDGVTPIATLVEEQLVAGGGNPKTRRPLTEKTQAALTETLTALNEGDAVLAEGKVLEVPGEYLFFRGATTLGLAEPVDLGPEEQAVRLQEALSNKGLTSYTFVLRPDLDDGHEWVVATISPRPVLSRFLYPGAGESYDGFPSQARSILDSEGLQVG